MDRLQTISRLNHRARGFTLIETALATVIVGVGIVASVQMFAACTKQNRDSSQMTTAMMLATNVQEAMGGLSFCDPGYGRGSFGKEPGETLATYDDVDDFDGDTYNPPIDSLRQSIANLGQFSQLVSVWPVYPNKLNVNNNPASPDIPKTTYTGAVRVTVRVLYRAKTTDPQEEVYRASWIRMDN